MLSQYVPRLFNMSPGDLEGLVGDWLSERRLQYVDWERCSGTGDGGRDVVGFETEDGYEGSWHNYQCKQLRETLTLPGAVLELAKIFTHVAEGHFTLPTRYVFVAPRGINRRLADLIRQPERFRGTFVGSWDEHCRDKLVRNGSVPMSSAIRSAIDAFPFRNLSALDGMKLVSQPDMYPALVRWFGVDPGPPPPPEACPDEIHAEEAAYVRQLSAAYSSRAGMPGASAAQILSHPRWGAQMRDQRVRYFDAQQFGRHYRKRVFKDVLVAFDNEIYHGVVDTHRDDGHRDALDQVNAVMKVAQMVQLSGPLRDQPCPQVKQGTCHRLAVEAMKVVHPRRG